MKKLAILLCCAAIGAFALAGCGEREGELVMYTNAEFPPFEYRGGNGRDIVGVDVDIMTEVAGAMGLKLRVEDMNFDAVVERVKTAKGNVVGAAGITRTPGREEQVNFSDTYYTAIQYILCRKEDKEKYPNLESLSGKKVGVQQGTTGNFIMDGCVEGNEDYQKVLDDSTEVQMFTSAPVAAASLKAKKLDAVVIDKLPALSIAARNTELTAYLLTDELGQVGEESYGIIVNKSNAALLYQINEVLNKLIAEGKIEQFVQNHYNGVEE